MTRNKPIETIRDGNLKAVIWENEGNNGPFFNVTYAKTYKDENGQPRDTQSFSGTDNLRIAELGRKAYDRTNDLRRDYYQSNEMDGDQGYDAALESEQQRSRAGRDFFRSRQQSRTRSR